MRVYRSGGLIKDAIYLRGLERLLVHLGAGRSLEPLLVGKLDLVHIPVMEEPRLRAAGAASLAAPLAVSSPGCRRTGPVGNRGPGGRLWREAGP